jgi:o-succinylbenzoate synthase
MLEKYCPDLQVLSIPLLNKFRGITTREVAIFRGSAGWSEFGPFLEYDDLEASTWMKAALEGANTPWPELHRDRVPINATLPIVEVDQVAGILRRFPGSTTVKIKIDDFESGAAVVEEVLNLYPEMKIRLDVNGGWDSDQAISNLIEYHLRFGNVFEYVEQPCQSLAELRLVKAEVPIPVAADESIRKNLGSDFADFGAYADVAILKWQPLGGIQRAHEIADEIGLPVVISSALETGIGISHGVALAASFPSASLACGLGTVALFEGDICDPAVIPHDGYIEVRRREPALVERYLATPERTEYWKQRIVRVLELLERRSA